MLSRERLVGIYRDLRDRLNGVDGQERMLEALGKVLAAQVQAKSEISSLHDVEFRIYSQWGDDGIIQWLVHKLPGLPKKFIEFGVDNYMESNTRFLMVNNNWSGLVMDGSAEKIEWLKRRKWFWRYDLTAKHAFLTTDNVDALIRDWAPDGEVGLLHIDVDGNDYWLWKAITSIAPPIVIMEYNALFGPERAITIPYDPEFRRHKAHHSGQYAGASLSALTRLAAEKGYHLIGTNSAGNNAYYVHDGWFSQELKAVPPIDAFTKSRFTDSRNRDGRLTFPSYGQRVDLIKGLPVFNVTSSCIEPF